MRCLEQKAPGRDRLVLALFDVSGPFCFPLWPQLKPRCCPGTHAALAQFAAAAASPPAPDSLSGRAPASTYRPKNNGPGNPGPLIAVSGTLPSVADLNVAVDHVAVLHRNGLSDKVAREGGRIIADVPFRIIARGGGKRRRNAERQSRNSGSKKQIFHDTFLSVDWTVNIRWEVVRCNAGQPVGGNRSFGFQCTER